MNRVFFGLALLMIGLPNALAGIVTKCESPTGWSYFVEGALVPKKYAGWTKDGISGGSFLVTQDDRTGYDIIYSDSIKRTVSSLEDGATIHVASKTNIDLVLLVIYPGLIETWYFRIKPNGEGDVTVSSARFGKAGIINKHSLMQANCHK